MSSLVNVSVSGGRTSAYMAHWLLNNREKVEEFLGVGDIEYVFTFANTGMEHEDTLRFMDAVDRHLLGGQTIWLESAPVHGEKKSSGYRIVDYKSAHRLDTYKEEDHPFHSAIRKYGVPNVSMQWCTRELKLNPINSYFKDLGIKRQRKGSDIWVAIGIRDDENRRVSKNATEHKIFYPLVDLEPTDKQDVLDFFKQFSWDLRIPEWQGNCVTCYKKSFKKLKQVYTETPEVFNFTADMEKEYGFIGPEFEKYGIDRPRVFFRGGNDTASLITLFDVTENNQLDLISASQQSACSESCEMYEMEV